MATIQKFEDIEAWKLGRELYKKIGSLIDSGKFKKKLQVNRSNRRVVGINNG